MTSRTDSVQGDALAFFGLPMQPPVAHELLTQYLQLAICTAAVPVGRDLEQTIAEVIEYRQVIESQLLLKIALRGADPERIIGTSRCAVVLGLQNMPAAGTKITEAVYSLYDAGVRIITPSYEGANEYGGGFLEPDVGLTIRGEILLTTCARLGMIVDLSHVGLQTASDILDFAEDRRSPKLKLMASHGGIADLFAGTTDPHMPRNLPLSMLMRLVGVGGLVGIYTLTFGLHESDDSTEPFLRHLDLAVRHLGSANVCIGSDAVYHEVDTAAQLVQFEKMRAMLDPTGVKGARCPDTLPSLNSVERMPRIEDDLLLAGFGPRSVLDDILGESLLRWLTDNLPE